MSNCIQEKGQAIIPYAREGRTACIVKGGTVSFFRMVRLYFVHLGRNDTNSVATFQRTRYGDKIMAGFSGSADPFPGGSDIHGPYQHVVANQQVLKLSIT